MVTEPGFLDYARVAIVTGVVSFLHYCGDDPQMWQPSNGVSKVPFTVREREGGYLHPPVYVVCGKVMFSLVSFCVPVYLFTRGDPWDHYP